MRIQNMLRHKYRYPDEFTFEGGGSVEGLDLAFHTSPRPYTPGEKVIWICHALTADSDVEDWWPEMVGSGKFLDTDKYFIVCCNMLGSCYGSEGPSSINPKTGKPYLLTFPRVSVRDIVRGLDLVRQHMGISHIDLLIGASIGGFQAQEWSIMCPDLFDRAIYVATLPRVTPWLSAFEESQRMALLADPAFTEAKDLDSAKPALACARSIAMLSYRNERGYNFRQWEETDDTLFADRSCSYQRYQGKKLADRFDAYSYYYLSYSVDSQNVGRGRGGVKAALSGIKAKSVVVSIDSDLIFPPYEMEEMAASIPGAEYKMITSLYGHDGFLLEYKQLQDIFAPMVSSL